MALSLLAPLLLAAAPISAAEAAGVNAAVAAIFRPYATPDSMNAAWEYPVFSASTAALIAEWQKVVPENEVDDLNGGDWFCQCQDWLSLRARVVNRTRLASGAIRARVRIDLGEGSVRTADMTFVNERGRWMLDEMVAPSFPRGLKQALRETTAADRKLRR